MPKTQKIQEIKKKLRPLQLLLDNKKNTILRKLNVLNTKINNLKITVE